MEQNRENLQQAIRQLPEHKPPAGLWDAIADQLDFEQRLEIPLRELPVYTPPSGLWDALEAQMDQNPELAPKKEIHPAFPWITAVLLLVLGWWLLRPVPTPAVLPAAPQKNEPIAQISQPQTPKTTQTNNTHTKAVAPKSQTTLTHRTEVVDDVLLMACQQSDDPDYQLLETLCQEALPVCEEPQFKQLKAEFDDLTHAHTALKTALGQYADDPDLVAQLVEIEHVRDQIMQQLMAMM